MRCNLGRLPVKIRQSAEMKEHNLLLNKSIPVVISGVASMELLLITFSHLRENLEHLSLVSFPKVWVAGG